MSRTHESRRAARLIVLLLLSVAPATFADSWALPKRERYCSIGKMFCVDIDPKPIDSQLRYFDDHVKGAENPGAGPDRPRTASATLLQRVEDGTYQKVRTFPLLNEVAPVEALVSADGKHLVTFDNWHSVGWGDDVVVIYRADGSVVKQYSLAQLISEKKANALPRSVSSIWWGGTHYLDRRRGHVVLQIVSEGSRLFDEDAKYTELRLDLASGERIGKR